MRHRVIYQCESCGREFDDEDECRRHELDHRPEGVGRCLGEALFWLEECMHDKRLTRDETHQLRKAYLWIAYVKDEHKGE